MSVLVPMPGESLWYEHHHPDPGSGFTFVFVNALLGSAGQWEVRIAPALRAAGHGTLAWDYRGQANSHTAAETVLGPDLMIGDLEQLVAEVDPRRPLLVGLAHGGLFATRALLAGLEAEGLVLINALRKPGVRQAWIDEALQRILALGGPALLQDLLLPVLAGPAARARLRPERLGTEPYRPLEPAGGLARLLRQAGAADWDVDYGRLSLPTLVISGLEDRLFGDPADIAELAGRLPDGHRLDLAGAGHQLPEEAPDATIDALLDFADRLRRRRA
jgi:pimeloyl-ACP methyl ester carboxylesterase